MGDFIAIDVETANSDIGSICAVGLVQFRDGQVVRDLSTLVNPRCQFDAINISIHGITADHVASAPTMDYLYPVFEDHFRDVVLVHHTHFDRSAFRKVAGTLGRSELACRWLDSARVTRRAWPKYAKRGYGLADVCYDFKIDFRHHDAAEDARAAGLVLCRALKQSGLTIDEWFKRVEQPIFPASKADLEPNSEGPLYGHTILFTGTLSVPRTVAQKMAAEAGCTVAKSLNRKTTLLVLGHLEEKSSKLEGAEEMIRAGLPLRILSEADFRLMAS